MADRRDRPYVGDYGQPMQGAGRIASASISMVLLACAIGFAVGVAVWGALSLSSLLVSLLWRDLPAVLPFDAWWLPLILCPLGGLLIGLWTRAFHSAPEPLDAVMGQVRATGGYRLRGGAAHPACADGSEKRRRESGVGRVATMFREPKNEGKAGRVRSGVTVSFFNEKMRLRRNESFIGFDHGMERLTELSPDELARLEQQYRAFRKR